MRGRQATGLYTQTVSQLLRPSTALSNSDTHTMPMAGWMCLDHALAPYRASHSYTTASCNAPLPQQQPSREVYAGAPSSSTSHLEPEVTDALACQHHAVIHQVPAPLLLTTDVHLINHHLTCRTNTYWASAHCTIRHCTKVSQACSGWRLSPPHTQNRASKCYRQYTGCWLMVVAGMYMSNN